MVEGGITDAKAVLNEAPGHRFKLLKDLVFKPPVKGIMANICQTWHETTRKGAYTKCLLTMLKNALKNDDCAIG